MDEMPEFTHQRKEMVKRYTRVGYIKSNAVAEAILRVPREEFMDPRFREYSYYDQPFAIPGDGRQTISAPYMYPISYEPLKLREGMKLLEVGAGSGYGAALARELVGETGKVVAIEINSVTHKFAKENLERAGYSDIELVLGDGSLGYPEHAPYDAVSITASTPSVPPPILDQLASPSRLIAPVGGSHYTGQDLLLLEKDEEGQVHEKKLMKVVYVPLLGEYGWRPGK
ncbi:MAG: protein-L-isoaspartate O-methyltransferase [Candidatus Bathyarchaeota archaeon]|nr:protein-L-isoaspartate O-methyltransferase [Candidatus Bathyarchaeota archaeon]